MDCHPPGSSGHGISQARILEWVAITFSRGSSWPRNRTCMSCFGRQIPCHWVTWEVDKAIKVKSLSCVRLFTTLWTVAHQAPQSMEFSRQEYWSGLPFPSPGDLPNPGIEPGSPTLQADALPSEPPGKPPDKAMLQIISNFRGCSYFWFSLSFQSKITPMLTYPQGLGFSQKQDHDQIFPKSLKGSGFQMFI